MPNWAGGGGGLLAGGGAGAGIGMMAGGPLGAAIGAGAGGLVGGLAGLFSGSKDKIKQFETLSPEQKQYLSSIFSQLQGMSGPGGNYGMAQDYNRQMLSGSPEAYERFAAPYKAEFEQETIPMLSERFAGLGGGLGGGAGGSSGFAQALGGAASRFQSNLSGLYAQLQQQAADRAYGQYNLLGQLGLGTTPFGYMHRPGTLGFGGEAGSGALQGIGSGVGQGLGLGLSERIAQMMKK